MVNDRIKISVTEASLGYVVDLEINKCSYTLHVLHNLSNLKSELAVAGLSKRTETKVIGLIQHEISTLK